LRGRLEGCEIDTGETLGDEVSDWYGWPHIWRQSMGPLTMDSRSNHTESPKQEKDADRDVNELW